ncbi:MAG TPA: substrate-binding domain-containing protein [Nocardioidaceae bacterium]|nr:substrate-binding domain-containing protein [Nocardioidaceae bacterium]
MGTRAALVAVAVTGLAACSSTGGAQEEQGGAGSSAGQADTPPMTVAMVTHAPAGDTFWDMVRSGAEVAAAKDNVELRYAGDADASNQATLLQNAIDSGVDGIAVTLTNPEAMAGAMARAEAAGIPVVVLNSGLDDWEELGALSFFGLDIEASGVMSGAQLAEAGGTKGLCVIQEQGSVVLEALCDGAIEAFTTGPMEKLYVTGTDLPSVQSTLGAKLQQDPSIDSIVTLNAPIGLAAVAAEADAGTTTEITTLNLSEDLLQPIEAGDILAVIDQQGWLQGYEAVDALWLYNTNANILGSGQPVLTGPTLINQENIDTVAPYVRQGTR